MARAHEAPESRPERVVILDADDPMVEIHGRIVWQEEHDRVVNEVRRQAYAEGYEDGQRDAASTHQQPVQIELRRRRSMLERFSMVVLIAGLLIILLMLPLVVQNALR